jgi:hypothetical protein
LEVTTLSGFATAGSWLIKAGAGGGVHTWILSSTVSLPPPVGIYYARNSESKFLPGISINDGYAGEVMCPLAHKF